MLKGEWTSQKDEDCERTLRKEAFFWGGLQVIGLLSLALLLFGCDRDPRPNQWDAFVYPNSVDLTQHLEIKGFKTFELCQQAAISLLQQLEKTSGSYECGYKCGEKPGWDGLKLCEKTRR